MESNTRLIFIISQPRSGSTLLQSIISNNNFVNTASEPWLLFHFLSYFNPELIKAKYNSDIAYKATYDFFEKTNFHKPLEKELNTFITKIYEMTLSSDGNYKYTLDKTPRYYEILDSVKDVFPEAKIIILKRNPFAVLNSIIDTWHVSGINRLYPYFRDIMKAPFILQQFIDKHSTNPNVLVTKYEDLVGDPRREAMKVYDWLNINFKEEYLDYSKNQKFLGKYGDSTGIHQAGAPVSKRADWRGKMKDNYWKNFFAGYANFLGDDFLYRYGYQNIEVNKKNDNMFKTFQFIADHKISDRQPIKNYYQYLYHRVKNKLYAR